MSDTPPDYKDLLYVLEYGGSIDRRAKAAIESLQDRVKELEAAQESMPDNWGAQPYVERLEDMSPEGSLSVQFDFDGDVIVSVRDERFVATVEFCTIGMGGGGSPHTRNALIRLFKAMERDNLESNRTRRGKRGRGASTQENTNG